MIHFARIKTNQIMRYLKYRCHAHFLLAKKNGANIEMNAPPKNR